MKSNLPQMSATLVRILLTYVMVFACAQAQEITSSKGYLQNTKGDIVRSYKSQDCVRTGEWASDIGMLEGCDGVVLLMSKLSMPSAISARHYILVPQGLLSLPCEK